MSDLATLAVLAARLLPFAQNVRHTTSRLRAERGAGWAPASSELMDSNLDKTLDRLRGGQIEDSWWRTILNLFGQKYIAPDFLTKPAVQDWLAQGFVGDGLKALAGAIVMGRDGEDAEVREQLAKSYSDRTGEAYQLAGGPIDVAVSMLVAGYIASIPADQLPLAGMVQDLSGRMEERFDRLEEARLSASTDSVTRRYTRIRRSKNWPKFSGSGLLTQLGYGEIAKNYSRAFVKVTLYLPIIPSRPRSDTGPLDSAPLTLKPSMRHENTGNSSARRIWKKTCPSLMPCSQRVRVK